MHSEKQEADPAQSGVSFVQSGAVVWNNLVTGRWVLVDQFDSEGQRHVVAAPGKDGELAKPLSDQQEQVARAAGQGLTSREIAKQLDLSERAVDGQLARALRKLGLPSRIALVRLWSALDRSTPL